MRFSFKISSSHYNNAFDKSIICLIIETLDICLIYEVPIKFLNFMIVVVILWVFNKIVSLNFIDLSQYNVCMIIILSCGSKCIYGNLVIIMTILKGLMITFNDVRYCLVEIF